MVDGPAVTDGWWLRGYYNNWHHYLLLMRLSSASVGAIACARGVWTILRQTFNKQPEVATWAFLSLLEEKMKKTKTTYTFPFIIPQRPPEWISLQWNTLDARGGEDIDRFGTHKMTHNKWESDPIHPHHFQTHISCSFSWHAKQSETLARAWHHTRTKSRSPWSLTVQANLALTEQSCTGCICSMSLICL